MTSCKFVLFDPPRFLCHTLMAYVLVSQNNNTFSYLCDVIYECCCKLNKTRNCDEHLLDNLVQGQVVIK